MLPYVLGMSYFVVGFVSIGKLLRSSVYKQQIWDIIKQFYVLFVLLLLPLLPLLLPLPPLPLLLLLLPCVFSVSVYQL